MQTITFPLLNLKLNIQSVAIRFGKIEIYWYAVIIVLAIIIGTIILKKRDGLYNIKFENVLELLLWLIPISFISARAYYVIFNLEYYLLNPIQIINVRNGGLAIYGGIIGGFITAIIYSKIKKINFLNLADYIIPTLALGQAIGRWGNFVNVEAYGIQTKLPWKMGIYEAGNYTEVHPAFLYESIIDLIIFFVLYKMKNKRKYEGQILFVYLLLYSFARTFIEGLRADSLMIGNIRVSQLISIIIFVGIIPVARATRYIKNRRLFRINC